MAEVKYLVTVDDESRRLLKVELMDPDGGLSEVPLDQLRERRRHRDGDSYTVNIFVGGEHGKVHEVTSGGDGEPEERYNFGFVLPTPL